MVKVRAALEAGTLGWAEVVIDPDDGYGPVDPAFLTAWEESYPNEFVHQAGDDTEADVLWGYVSPGLGDSMPQGGLVDADYKWQVTGIFEAIAAAANL